eukprot:NODE_1151_length_1447_cov_155.337879_g1140_i0.p1 GENE.NODE_1151_length_1447_cov_155.337879_g1140_i0~~NODE_1151_length_1447_cov_155.337879_g1140_i0.p1  ORF type:complete len:442 (+),score=135.03 NODE_1151_length_1447_cov_155.337879_g1140_i0:82-1326(+)
MAERKELKDRVPSETDKTSGSGSWVEGPYGFETQLVHGGQNPDPISGAILQPIVQATTFIQPSIANYLESGYSYSRTRNPTVESLARRIAQTENAAGVALFSTGMAATVTVMSAFLKKGDHCVITDCSYGGTNRVARVMFAEYGIEFSFVDFSNTDNIAAAIKDNTKLIFSETPANPVLKLTDLAAVSKLAKSKGIPHVCDGTFATPVIMRALDLGCDMALHSTTKYYDGHNMTVGGAVASATKELDDKIHFYQNMHGNIMSPMVAFLTLQATKTLQLRITKQSQTAQVVAEMLEGHPNVDKVVYPGLKSFAQKELADRQHMGGLHGGMLWFEVKGGTAAGQKLMDTAQRPWSLCENLGATESILTCPAVMTHANMLKEDRDKLGITDGFVRVSCGIEDTNDLVRALKLALDNL